MLISSPLLDLPLETRHQIFESLILTPHTITVSFNDIENCRSPIENIARICKQFRDEIVAWSTLNDTSEFLHGPSFGLVSQNITIQFHLHLPHSKSRIRVSKTPENIEELAVFQL